jgi:hypothetical protein
VDFWLQDAVSTGNSLPFVTIQIIKVSIRSLTVPIDTFGISCAIVVLDKIIFIIINAEYLVQGIWCSPSDGALGDTGLCNAIGEIPCDIVACLRKRVMDEWSGLERFFEEMSMLFWYEIREYVELPI